MLAILFLSGSAAAGFCLVRRGLRNFLDSVEHLLWGLVLGWVLASLGVYVIARWQGHLSFRLVLWATTLSWMVAAILSILEFRRADASLSLLLPDPVYKGLAIVLILLAPVYWRLLAFQMFAPGPDGVYSGSGGNDLSFHAALAASFAFGGNLPATYVLLPPQPLFYPYLPDFQLAILLVAGMSLRSAMILTGLVLGAVIAGLFYSFALRISRLARAATLATVLFLLNGGLGFFYFLRDWWQSDKSTVQFWNTLPFNYAKLSERGIHWTNIVADMFVPQRTSLFGFAIALMVLTIFAVVWQKWHRQEVEIHTSPSETTLMIFAGVLTGVLPFFHTHTYIGLGLLSAMLFLLKPRWTWLCFWTAALLVSAPQLLTLALHAQGSGIVRPFFGWLGHDDRFFPLYLVRNFGLPLVLAIPAWWTAPREWRKFYLAFLILFIFPFVIVFSPNLYDNGKLIYFWHALNSVMVAGWLVRPLKVSWWRPVFMLLTFCSIATALLVFHSEVVTSKRLFSDEEIAAAKFIRNQTSPRALFLTAPALQSPALSLAGRPVVRGATAWIWSHGYEFREREGDVRRIYAGTPDALDLMRYYGVDYVYLGDAERADVKANTAFFDAHLPAIYRTQTITIYDARTLKSQSSSPSLRFDIASRLDRDPYSMIEGFADTSYFVYRLFKASYGRMPRRDEFVTAMQRLGAGLNRGSSLREAQLHRNRSELLVNWTTSQEFTQLYQGKMNAEFVDLLLRNADLSWSSGKRNQLLQSLASQPDSRQAALLSVVDDREFFAREYNNAYVLVHFFGYLRRNPDDAPDFDLKGFTFWRDRLNSWGDYRTISLAFMESDEYRKLQPAP